MRFPFSIFNFGESDEVNLTAFINGEMYSCTNAHANYERIREMCEAGDESVVSLFDISGTAQERFRRLSERVSISGGVIYFDGEPVDNSLTQQVVRFIEDGVEDFEPLIHFFEKVQTNPNPHSREQLYRWLADRAFTINPEGNILAYKGVDVRSVDGQNAYFSISHGRAIVDGEVHNGAIPNPIGAVVEMPRSDVQHDPSVGCHTGLHAGTWNYASNFAQGAVLTVEVNPRDVVSVPTDCEDQKMRVCRYKVVEVVENQLPTALHGTVDTSDVDEYDDEEAGFQELDPVSDESDDNDSVVIGYKFDSVQPYTPVNWLTSTYEPDDPEAPWNS
jgi:hypothetical protein